MRKQSKSERTYMPVNEKLGNSGARIVTLRSGMKNGKLPLKHLYLGEKKGCVGTEGSETSPH